MFHKKNRMVEYISVGLQKIYTFSVNVFICLLMALIRSITVPPSWISHRILSDENEIIGQV